MAKARSKSRPGLILIGIFKLFKGILLVLTGIGALKLLNKDIEATTMHWVQALRIDPDNYYIHRMLTKVTSVSPKELKELSVGTFFYAALLLTEGIGLLMRKHWAEYFTIIVTGSFIPLEIYEMWKRFTSVRLLVFAINVAVVVYLIRGLRGRR